MKFFPVIFDKQEIIFPIATILFQGYLEAWAIYKVEYELDVSFLKLGTSLEHLKKFWIQGSME
jgi:hypothetical protein